MLRAIRAFLIAPFPGALFHAVLVALWPRPGAAIYQHPASMFVAMCLIHYALGLVLGVPAYLALRKRRSHRLAVYALAGAVMLLIPMGLVIAWLAAHQGVPFLPPVGGLFRFGVGGLLTGATFWFLFRPDRRAAMRAVAADKARLSVAFD